MAEPLPDGLDGVVLDPSSPVPLYYQAATQLERLIREGALPPGEMLEGEVELAERFEVSRPTMREALKLLVDKGLLVRQRGVGTVVASMPIHRPLALTSLHKDLRRAGRTPTTRVLSLERVPCPEEAREALQLAPDEDVWALRRVRFADGEPIALMRNLLPAGAVELDAGELEDGSLYELLRRQGVRLHSARQWIGAAAATDEQAERLGVEPGAPLVSATRISYDAAGTPLEHAYVLYPAHAYTFEMTLRVES